jgi:hypothetical protein
MAQVPVLLERPSSDRLTIYVDRSLAGHLRDWFNRAIGADEAHRVRPA